MNVKRFTARTTRDALALVRQAFGDDAVVMSTRPCAEGVEVLAMTPESVEQLERVTQSGTATPRGHAGSAASGGQAGTVGSRGQALSAGTSAPSSPSDARGRGDGAARRMEPSFLPGEPPAEGRGAGSAGAATPPATSVAEDVAALQMSTLSFQDYVRDRMLRRRQAELAAQVQQPAEPPPPTVVAPIEAARARMAAAQRARAAEPGAGLAALPVPGARAPGGAADAPGTATPAAGGLRALAERQRAAEPPVLREELRPAPSAAMPPASRPAAGRSASLPAGPTLSPRLAADAAGYAARASEATQRAASRAAVPVTDALHAGDDHAGMMDELRAMRGLIEQRFGALAFMEKMQRQPRQAALAQQLLDGGFSPALIRRLVLGLPDDQDGLAWAAAVLERNLATAEREPALEDVGGIYALIGATGVGKTTSTAKLAAAFATRHGAANLGLITLDAYRMAAHEQLRAYGRILGVPVHTAHDRASLEDLLDLLSGKRMVLIDTAGMAQRDSRTRELLEMLSHRAIQRVLVLNAAAQGETLEDQIAAYAASTCRGLVLSKVDEAVKLGPALDAVIRHRLRVLAVANGQRVPEDWHRLSAHSLVQRAMRNTAAPAWRLDNADVNLIFAGLPAAAPAAPGAGTAQGAAAAGTAAGA
jgi:flagellar biosynthesis protein FlhF